MCSLVGEACHCNLEFSSIARSPYSLKMSLNRTQSSPTDGLPSHLALRILLSPPSKDGVTGSSHPQHLQTFRRSKLPASGLAYVSAAVAAESSPLCSLKINKNKQTKTRIITMRIISVKYVKYPKEKWTPRSCL